MTRWVGDTVRVFATALVALVLAHNLIFLAGYGAAYADVLTRTGHDRAWTIAVVFSLTLGGSLLLAAALRLHRLRRLAHAMGATHMRAEPDLADFGRRWLCWWIALTVATALLFVLRENVEHSRVAQQLPGIGVLASAAYPNAVVIIAAVALAVSLVAALLGWELDLVMARIRAMPAAIRPTARPAFRPGDWIDRRRGSILGGRLAGRAPPLGTR